MRISCSHEAVFSAHNFNLFVSSSACIMCVVFSFLILFFPLLVMFVYVISRK